MSDIMYIDISAVVDIRMRLTSNGERDRIDVAGRKQGR
jgi:hypothetical protein